MASPAEAVGASNLNHPTPYRVLVPLDGSSRAEKVIPCVDTLARELRADVQLIQVIDPREDPFVTGAPATESALDAMTQLATSYLQDVGARFRHAATNVFTSRGPAAETIVQHAQANDIDLIVMSTHGQSGLMEALLGSVARNVVRDSYVPVLVLRERVVLPTDLRRMKVLVPLDGADLVVAVVEPLMGLARALNWSLILCWVADLPDRLLSARFAATPDEHIRALYPERVAELERLAGRINSQGVAATVLLDCGTPAPRIAELERELNVGLVGLSTHGRRGFGRLVLGSVTEYLIGRGNAPVLTVRPSSRDREPGHHGC